MSKITSENNLSDPDLWDRDHLDRDLEGSILEEIEEIPGETDVQGTDRLQILLLPLAALIIIAGVPMFFGIRALNRNQADIGRDFPYTSIESPLLRSAVQEINGKRREIDLKDIRIRRYQERVLELDNQLRELQNLSQATLQEKEMELLTEIDQVLSGERERLRGLGRSDTQIDAEISEMKTGLDTEYNEKMDDFRSRELRVYQQKLNRLEEDRRQLNQALEAAVSERQNLARTLESDEELLLSELYREKNFIELVNAGIDADLEILRETRQVEYFWLNELASQYLGLMDAIGTRDSKRAEEYILSLRSLFNTAAKTQSQGIRARSQADREIVSFLGAYVETMDQQGADGLTTEIRMLVDQAAARMSEGRYQEADIAWRKIGKIWPLMDQITSGTSKTRDELLGAEIRLYAADARRYLVNQETVRASAIWNTALNAVPDPAGDEIQSFWLFWKKAYENQLDELNDELWESRIRLAAKEMEIVRLNSEISDLSDESEVDRDAISQMVPRSELDAAHLRIMELERLITELESRKEDAAEKNGPSGPAVKWAPYGVIKQVAGESLIVEPFGPQNPGKDTLVRIMRSLGGDRAIHLADGMIVEANESRAVIRVLSRSEGSESYSTPRINDIVYLSAP
jgi:predicted  nucleic acid-binding Zn-ribbon protein